jgi:Uma2 family endonuclease
MQAHPIAVVPEQTADLHEEYLSFQEYLKRYASVEGMRTEWNAGKVMQYPVSNNIKHLYIFQFVHLVLQLFLAGRKLGQVIPAAFPMYYADDKPAREPDMMVILNTHLDRIKETYLDGVADIAIEIVSPESDERDRGAKFVEYEAAGVPEYWLIDPLRQDAIIYALGEDNRYHRVALDAQGRAVSSLLPGFALDPALLWRDAAPDALAIVELVGKMS